VTVTSTVTCLEAVDQLPVVGEDNGVVGVITEGNLTSKLMSGRVKNSDCVTNALYPQFRRVMVSTTLAELARIFDHDHFAVVVQSQRMYTGGKGTVEKSVVVGVVSRIDLLKFVMTNSTALASSDASSSSVSSSGVGATMP
jgi:cystathionine beta-synthase